MKEIFIITLVILYNLLLIILTGYLVFYKDINGFWFIVTISLLLSYKDTKDDI